jgi:hypothetical protein
VIPWVSSILLGLRGSGSGRKRDHHAAELGALNLVQRSVDSAGLACGTNPGDLDDLVGRQAQRDKAALYCLGPRTPDMEWKSV